MELQRGLNDIEKELEIGKVIGVEKSSKNKVIINMLTGKSGLHVRPSTVLAMEFLKLRKKYLSDFKITFINEESGQTSMINGPTDILALGLRSNVSFNLVLEGDDLDKGLINELITTLNGLENHQIAGCESVPNAINKILDKQLL